MLLTITYTGKQTRDLGYLLHKNPDRAQCFALSFGNAYVFYPEASEERTTAALLLDLNPVDLARGKLGTREGGLFDYVNDRPYVASSFLSTAIARVFSTAMSGRCEKRQALSDTPLDLTACVHMLPGDAGLAAELFEPLGYSVTAAGSVLDETFPEWGGSPYIDLTLRGKVTLSRLLNHLYVLIPAFDRQKHYYVGKDEIEKLLSHGEDWLAGHPARDQIVKRYFAMQRSFAREAISRMTGEEEERPASREERERRLSLNARRLEAVKDAVLESGAVSVIDLGCGEGKLTAMLLKEKQLLRVAAADVSLRALERARQNLQPDRMPPSQREKLTWMQASLTYRDERFSGFDAACVVEVVEHLDPQRLPAFERVLFEFAAPRTVVLTTPNRAYNLCYPTLAPGALRHEDHRFEWTREEFRAWAEGVCERFGYTVELREIGDLSEGCGAPTQMGVFTKCG